MVELLKLDYNVYIPVNPDSKTDLIVETKDKVWRLQVKKGFIRSDRNSFGLETRRISKKGAVPYDENDFDFAIGVDIDKRIFWIVPVKDFISYKSSFTLETEKALKWKEAWNLLK